MSKFFDDVAVTEADGMLTAIQTKSALTTNPIADKSVEWWKAMASWVQYLKDHPEHLGSARFVIYVFSPKNGPIAESFSTASNATAALAALDQAKLALWGATPLYLLRETVPKTVKPYIEAVLTADTSTVCAVIERFSLTFGSGCSRDDIRQLLLTKFVPSEHVDHVVDKCAGWVKGQIESAIQCGSIPSIRTSDFLQETNAFLSRLRFANLLTDFAGTPSSVDVASHDLKTYVAQLRIIDANEEEILAAINSYLRAATNRSTWAEKFLVHEDSFDDYETALQAFGRTLESSRASTTPQK